MTDLEAYKLLQRVHHGMAMDHIIEDGLAEVMEYFWDKLTPEERKEVM